MLGRGVSRTSTGPHEGINPAAANAAQLFKNSRRFIFLSPLKKLNVQYKAPQNSRRFNNTGFN
jgi:hypothetical protein